MKTIPTRLSSLSVLFHPLLLASLGVVLLSLSIISLIAWIYEGVTMPEIVSYITLQFLPGSIRSLVLALLGMAFLAAGIWKLSDVMVFSLSGATPDGDKLVLGYERTSRHPRIVVLSGGAGMLILSSLGKHVERLTCITPIQDSVEYYYRASSLFEETDTNVYYVVPTPSRTRVLAELDDGTVKNVMTVNLDPSLAERHVARIMLAAEQEPASTTTSTPRAKGTDHSPPDSAALTPLSGDLPLTRLAREALRDADIIVLGPGSLFESVLPNLLLDELRTAVQQSNARTIYICNLMTEPGLTTGFGVGDHIRQIKRYGGFSPDYVLVNVQRIDPEVRQIYADFYQIPVSLSPEEYEETTVPGNGSSRRRVIVEESVVIEADLASSVIRYSASLDNPSEQQAVRVLRHDPQKLTSALLELLQRG